MTEIKFTSKEHEYFYKTMIQKSGNRDSYHRVFFYCVGISDTARRNINRIFDFEQDRIKPDGLREGWQTGGTVRITRLAFNLWNGYMAQGEERMSTPYEMFDCSYSPYFYEAIKYRQYQTCPAGIQLREWIYPMGERELWRVHAGKRSRVFG